MTVIETGHEGRMTEYWSFVETYNTNTGMTLKAIGELLGYSTQKACRLKKWAYENGDITDKNRRGGGRGKGYTAKYNYQTRSKKYYVKNGHKYCGAYEHKEEAEIIAKEMKKCGWDTRKLPEIWKRTGIYPTREKFKHYYRNGRNWSVLRKTKEDGVLYCGTFPDEETAQMIADMMGEVDWDMNELPRIIREVQV